MEVPLYSMPPNKLVKLIFIILSLYPRHTKYAMEVYSFRLFSVCVCECMCAC